MTTAASPSPSARRAVALLGSAAVATSALGAVSAKVTALVLSVEQFGDYAVLITVTQMLSVALSVGLPAGVVRSGARAPVEVLALAHRARGLVLALTIASVALIAVIATGYDLHTGPVAVVASGTLAAGAVATAMYNATGAHSALSRLIVLVAVVGNISYVAALSLTDGAYEIAVLVQTLAGLLVPSALLLRRARSSPKAASLPLYPLLRFGTGYTMAAIAGAIAAGAPPLLAARQYGDVESANVRVAMTIGVSYLAILLVAVSQEYYPRLARLDGADVGFAVHAQLNRMLCFAGPLIVCVSFLAPELVQVLYSDEFTLAPLILSAVALGDVLKVCSWCISFAVLTHGSTRRYVLLEVSTSATAVVIFACAGRFFGPASYGGAYAVTYALYLGWVLVNARSLVAPPTARQWLAIGVTCFGAALGVAASPYMLIVRLLLGAVAAIVVAVAAWACVGRPGNAARMTEQTAL